MPRRVKGPDGVVHVFPDDATDDEISVALDSSPPSTLPDMPPDVRAQFDAAMRAKGQGGPDLLLQNAKNVGKEAVQLLPAAGGMVGGAVGSIAGPGGAILGAGLGGAAGAGARQIANDVIGEPTPQTNGEALRDIATQGGLMAAGQGVMEAAPWAWKAAAPFVKSAAASTGRGVAATGRGIEAVATSPAAQHMGTGGAILAASRGNLNEAAMSFLAPRGAAMAGRGLQRVGSALEGAAAAPKPSAIPGMAPRLAGRAPQLDATIEGALEEMLAKPEAAATPRLPEYPQAATDTMRNLADRQAAAKAAPPVKAAAPAPPAPAPKPAPIPAAKAAPVESAPPEPKLPRAVKPKFFDVNDGLRQVKEAFESLGETPGPAEASNAVSMMRHGMSAEDAVANIMKYRPAPNVSVSQKFAERFGLPSDADVQGSFDAKWARGKLKTPSAETARARRAGQ